MEEKVAEKRQRISTLGQIGLQQFAPYLMNRIMGRYNATLRDDFRKQGLTIPQVRTLAVLSVTDGITVNDLSVYTVIEQSTLAERSTRWKAKVWCGASRASPTAASAMCS